MIHFSETFIRTNVTILSKTLYILYLHTNQYIKNAASIDRVFYAQHLYIYIHIQFTYIINKYYMSNIFLRN